ncbi:hypothetical protein EGT36_17740 [Agrobacterium sp. FDAARGOS_525]|nr:hypothetical protein EGT36_17740 [Agrobacterium sp. FDAARGOS_525]
MIESVPAKVEWEFSAKPITWTKNVNVETMEIGASNGHRATNSLSLQSDGEMLRVTAPVTP